MAHLLPKLVPPVDREYTLRLLFGRGDITNGIDIEWKKPRQVLEGFSTGLVTHQSFNRRLKNGWTFPIDTNGDTSPLKIVDNLVIGLSAVTALIKTLRQNASSSRMGRICVALPLTRTTRGKEQKTDNREEVLPHRFNGNKRGENAYEEASDSCRCTLVE
jgi:hypothetical protein